jgi:TetR/AcrR family transcriptional repressor of mexJK operon
VTKTATAFQPRRGRPNASQAAAIERAILSTARQRFLEDGYDAVSMESVAGETGVSKGTLYARYASKEALFTAVVEAAVQDWSEASARNDHLLTDDIGERLRHHAATIAASLVQPDVRAFQRLLLANRDRFPELSRVMYDIGYVYIVKLITRDIEEASKRDRVPVSDAKGVAALLVSAITGWQLQESSIRDLAEGDIVAFGNRTVDLMLSGRSAW